MGLQMLPYIRTDKATREGDYRPYSYHRDTRIALRGTPGTKEFAADLEEADRQGKMLAKLAEKDPLLASELLRRARSVAKKRCQVARCSAPSEPLDAVLDHAVLSRSVAMESATASVPGPRHNFAMAALPGQVGANSALRIRCHSCAGTDSVRLPSGKVFTCTQAEAEAIFVHRGWHLGETRERDQCRLCFYRMRPRSKPGTATLGDVMPPEVIALSRTIAMPEHLDPVATKEAMPMNAPSPAPAEAAEKTDQMHKRERRATLREKFAILELLKEQIETVEESGEDKRFRYKPGWTDVRVAEAVAPGLRDHHVAYVRQEFFGPLITRDEANKGRNRSLESELLELHRQIGLLVKFCQRLDPTFEAA